MDKNNKVNLNEFRGDKGNYRVIEKLGSGGMSDVYKVEDASRNKFALKALKMKKDNLQVGERLESLSAGEIDIMNRLREQNIENVPKIVDMGDGFYVMELCSGETLRRNSLSGKDAIKISIALCDILSRLHNLNPPIIHLDLKPSNIICGEDKNVFLIDFGLARSLVGYKNNHGSYNNKSYYGDRKADRSTIAGTKGYAAPEQYGGLIYEDKRTDIYLFGRTLKNLINEDITDPFLYKELKKVTGRCSFVKIQQRYQNIEEVKADILKCRERADKDRCIFAAKLALALVLFVITVLLIIMTFVYRLHPLYAISSVLISHLFWDDERLRENWNLMIHYVLKRVKLSLIGSKQENRIDKNEVGSGIFIDIVKTCDSLEL